MVNSAAHRSGQLDCVAVNGVPSAATTLKASVVGWFEAKPVVRTCRLSPWVPESVPPMSIVAVESLPIESVPIGMMPIGIEPTGGAGTLAAGIDESIGVVDPEAGIDDSDAAAIVEVVDADPSGSEVEVWNCRRWRSAWWRARARQRRDVFA